MATGVEMRKMKQIKDMTLLGIYRKAYAYFREAPGKCVNRGGACVYRSGTSNCVVGSMLTDDELDKIVRVGLNSSGPGSISEIIGIDPRTEEGDRKIWLLIGLQEIHDSGDDEPFDMDDVRKRMRKLRDRYGF
jgi:hypothetical protein